MAEKKKNFEESLAELEKIVAEMEGGGMGLEEMVAAFERGQKLVKECGKRLDEIERKIEVIRRGADGAPAGTGPLPEMEEPTA
ncbi:MAG: exodeoxyribonuclease VII small subunit [Kiritimatiellae bacterium]|nr:exodeoxyribonuclease VII small subunit [Kiritimatiellia bacterium]